VLNEEPRRAIIEILDRDGRVWVMDMARKFETSRVTIRQDSRFCTHTAWFIVRMEAHCGSRGALEDPTLREKEKLHRKEKLRIADVAASLVKEGQVVILDSGTTTTAIARALRNFHNIRLLLTP